MATALVNNVYMLVYMRINDLFLIYLYITDYSRMYLFMEHHFCDIVTPWELGIGVELLL